MKPELPNFTTETFLPIPFRPAQNGPYKLVSVDQSMQRPKRIEYIWWDEARGAKVTEIAGKEHDPITFVYLDVDNTMFQDEQPGRFFDTSWAMMFRELGVSGSDEAINALRWRVYKWNRNVATSTYDMLQRIEHNVDVHDRELKVSEISVLRKLLERYPEDDLQTVAQLIADRKEDLGAAVIRRNPAMVEKLAPLSYGFIDFLHAIPSDIPVAIGSPSRRSTIIEPILNAHDYLHPEYGLMKRFRGYILGEEDAGGVAKPDREFFEMSLRGVIALNMHNSGFNYHGRVFSVEDALYIGDKRDLDIAKDRNMYFLTVNENLSMDQSDGPLTARVPNFDVLMRLVRSRQYLHNSTLQRIAMTLR